MSPKRDSADVVDVRRQPVRRLRRAVGYRVDGPDGRIGTLRAVTPDDAGGPPTRIRISVGLFIPATVEMPVAEVYAVDAVRGRVLVRTAPELPRRSPSGLARRFRRFARTVGARESASSDRRSP